MVVASVFTNPPPSPHAGRPCQRQAPKTKTTWQCGSSLSFFLFGSKTRRRRRPQTLPTTTTRRNQPGVRARSRGEERENQRGGGEGGSPRVEPKRRWGREGAESQRRCALARRNCATGTPGRSDQCRASCRFAPLLQCLEEEEEGLPTSSAHRSPLRPSFPPSPLSSYSTHKHARASGGPRANLRSKWE